MPEFTKKVLWNKKTAVMFSSFLLSHLGSTSETQGMNFFGTLFKTGMSYVVTSEVQEVVQEQAKNLFYVAPTEFDDFYKFVNQLDALKCQSECNEKIDKFKEQLEVLKEKTPNDIDIIEECMRQIQWWNNQLIVAPERVLKVYEFFELSKKTAKTINRIFEKEISQSQEFNFTQDQIDKILKKQEKCLKELDDRQTRIEALLKNIYPYQGTGYVWTRFMESWQRKMKRVAERNHYNIQSVNLSVTPDDYDIKYSEKSFIPAWVGPINDLRRAFRETQSFLCCSEEDIIEKLKKKYPKSLPILIPKKISEDNNIDNSYSPDLKVKSLSLGNSVEYKKNVLSNSDNEELIQLQLDEKVDENKEMSPSIKENGSKTNEEDKKN